ncbi:AcrR family transcriptional regulator [Actinoalloteichus hoggarensis]|uniref:Transcriptional regulator, TetR family n=1 Tax=Actinoalloteichus hoggarensis TaxID=1470176 RepID=A0A221W3T8_9PSEU|nr:TetR/AcrR family transcriptional regulator [Actinoalloteichus hoggarensis]ASO20424.1 Transcriptional regulator, TetR family [Actinoalloteichus hoggarensis]MBB5923463.1 AcrR family transcriptional regulator [Actinoalloteichus hoggarensis]
MSATPRRRRSDAARNRAALLTAAREAFAARGLAVDVREVARRAGVGIATLYRHFPTKDDLVAATLEKDLTEWSEAAAVAVATEDAWFGLTLIIEQTLAVMARHRAVLDGLSEPRGAPPILVNCLMTLRGMLDGLVARAHRQGTLRLDVSAVDVGLLILALGRVVRLSAVPGGAAEGTAANAVWRRHTGFVLDGLHTHAVRE